MLPKNHPQPFRISITFAYVHLLCKFRMEVSVGYLSLIAVSIGIIKMHWEYLDIFFHSTG